MSEKLTAALMTTVMGMGIVIITLYVLSIILNFMKYIFHPEKKETTQKTNTQPSKTTKPKEEDLKNESESTDNEQLVAVISAALSAYLERPISQIKIGTIRKIHTKSPVWSMASRLKGKL